MKKQSWFYRLLKWLGFIKTYDINKKEMCEKAKSLCNNDCERCVWYEE